MKLIRSWPAVVPPNRAHVVDTMQRHVMSDYSYRGLGDYEDDILLVEWDVAVGVEDLTRLRERIAEDPARVVVAPYKVYEATTRPTPLSCGPVWVHRKYIGAKQSTRFVDEGEPDADLWGLGLTYLPRDIIREFLDYWPGHFSDTSLSGWHYDRYGPVPIAWDVRPVHLHYSIKELQ